MTRVQAPSFRIRRYGDYEVEPVFGAQVRNELRACMLAWSADNVADDQDAHDLCFLAASGGPREFSLRHYSKSGRSRRRCGRLFSDGPNQSQQGFAVLLPALVARRGSRQFQRQHRNPQIVAAPTAETSQCGISDVPGHAIAIVA